MEDIKGYATSEDVSGRPADLPGRTSSSSNVLARTTRGTQFQTLKIMREEEGCCGAGAWVKLLRACKGKNASRSQRLTERVHDIKRVSSYSEVLARRDMWEATLKEHDMDTGYEVADITMANCFRRLVHPHLSADFHKMSHIVRCCDVKKTSSTKLVCDCVTTKSAQRVSQMVSNQWTRASLCIVITMRQERPMAMMSLHGTRKGGYGNGWTWMTLGPTLGKVNQVHILLRNSMHGSLEMAPLCLDWK